MQTRRRLILGSAALGGAALLAACGKADAPVAAPLTEPVDISLPSQPAYGLALIAQARQLWGDMTTNLVLANDDATLVRGFNSGLIEFGGMAMERFLFWRSGGSKVQLAAWASRDSDPGKSWVYAVREEDSQQAARMAHFIIGLKAADDWMRANPADAAKLIAEQVGTPVDPASLSSLIAGADTNRSVLAPGGDGESASLKEMRKLDDAMRDDGSAGHRAFDPSIIAPAAVSAWAK